MLAQYENIVYVLDPDDAVRDGLRILLESFDIQVREYPEAQSFLREAAANTRGCALIENHLPDLEGLTVLSRLRGMGNTLPVLLLTSSHDERLARQALEKGAANVIRKPLLNDQLLRQLAMLLDPAPPGLADFRA